MQCEFCKEEIADEATICRFCQKPTAAARKQKAASRAGALVWIISIVVVGFAVLMMIGNAAPEDIKAINNAKFSAKQGMRDPSSASFGKVVYSAERVVCGYVRGRNGFGGMTETAFYAIGGGSTVTFKEGEDDRAFEMSWADFGCPAAMIQG